LGRLLVSAHYWFFQGGQMYCYSLQTEVGPPWPYTAWFSTALCPNHTRQSWNFPPFIRPPVLSRRDAICLQAMLDYMVSSRANDVACSPGMVALSLCGICSI
jgi:hypothetical protein